jgi:hypothetical protein
LNSTTFYYPINQNGKRSENVLIHHHGHAQTCDNTVKNGSLDCPIWFDFYNVTTFVHTTLGMDINFMYMPLLGPNQQHGYPTQHQWFQSWESKGDRTMRYFIEPVILTINHLLSLGYKKVFMMGKSGGGWTTTVAAAADPRISVSFPIAGSVRGCLVVLSLEAVLARDGGGVERHQCGDRVHGWMAVWLEV